MADKQIQNVKNIESVFLNVTSGESSREKTGSSGNTLAHNINLEKTLNSSKEAVKGDYKKVFSEFDEKLNEVWEMTRQTGTTIEIAINEINNSFAEEKVLYNEMEEAAEKCISANLNYIEKAKKYLITNRDNKRRLGQLIETINSKQEGPSSHKIKKM